MIKESKIYIKSIFRWKVTLSQKGLGSLFRSSFLQKDSVIGVFLLVLQDIAEQSFYKTSIDG